MQEVADRYARRAGVRGGRLPARARGGRAGRGPAASSATCRATRTRRSRSSRQAAHHRGRGPGAVRDGGDAQGHGESGSRRTSAARRRTPRSWRARWRFPPSWGCTTSRGGVRHRRRGADRRQQGRADHPPDAASTWRSTASVAEARRTIERGLHRACSTSRRRRGTGTGSCSRPTSRGSRKSTRCIEYGAEGVGLFRSEYLFLSRDRVVERGGAGGGLHARWRRGWRRRR